MNGHSRDQNIDRLCSLMLSTFLSDSVLDVDVVVVVDVDAVDPDAVVDFVDSIVC